MGAVGPSYASFLLGPGRPGSDSIPGAAFRVKQESGFVVGTFP